MHHNTLNHLDAIIHRASYSKHGNNRRSVSAPETHRGHILPMGSIGGHILPMGSIRDPIFFPWDPGH